MMVGSAKGTAPAGSRLPWLWVIEYLASSERVNLQLLNGLIESVSVSSDELGRNTRELISLRCLEQLCGPENLNKTVCDVPSNSGSCPVFELSQSCEDVLGFILQEASVSDFRMAGREQLKSQVRRFVTQKRTCMPKSALEQLKDAILDGTHPDAALLKVLSGLAHLTDDRGGSIDNIGHGDIHPCEPDVGRDYDPNMGPNRNPNSAEHDGLELHLEGDSRTSPPSKRNLTSLNAENLAQNSKDNQLIDDDVVVLSPIAKKLKRSNPDAIQTEKAGPSVVNESDSRRNTDAEQGKLDLAQDQMESSHEDQVMEERPENCDEQRGISDRFPDVSDDVVIVQDSSARGHTVTLEKTIDVLSPAELQQRKIIVEDVVDLMDQLHADELSSDSDVCLNEELDLSMKKDLLVSHCKSMSDSLENLMQIEQNVCMKCKKVGQFLVCRTSRCPVVVHEKCVDSSSSFNENGNFFCPLCQYHNSISEYLEAKKEATSAREDLGASIRSIYKHQLGNLGGTWHDHLLNDIDECNDVYGDDVGCQEEGVHQEQGGPDDCAVGVNDRQGQGNEGDKEQEEPGRNGDLENGMSDEVHRDEDSEGQAKTSGQNSDLISISSMEDEEEVSNGAATAAGAEENEKTNIPQSNGSRREVELDILGSNLDATTSVKRRNEEGDQQEALHDGSKEPKPGEDSSEDDIEDADGDSALANYLISFRRRANRRVRTSPVATPRKQKKPPWTEDEVKLLKEGVEKFFNQNDQIIEWKKILEFGAGVLMQDRTTRDLKNKWTSIRKSPKSK